MTDTRQLRKELARLRMENDIFKKAPGILCQGVAVKYAWIQTHRKQFPVSVMCRALKISTSGYYDSVKRKPCRQLIRRQSIVQAAAVSYFQSHRVYGYRKVCEDVAEG